MNTGKTGLWLAIVLLPALITLPRAGYAQATLAQSFLGGGGGFAAGPDHRLYSSLGQPAGGAARNDVQQGAGFGFIAGSFLNNLPETIADLAADQIPLTLSSFESDQGAVDTQEFVEIMNPGMDDIGLAGGVLVLYDGANSSSYFAVDLLGTVPAGGSFRIGNAAAGGVSQTFPDGTMQDGPDAIALYKGEAARFPFGTRVTVDALISAIVYVNDGEIFGRAKRGARAAEVLLSLRDFAAQTAKEIPGTYVLEPNYPNPFNPRTVIRFGMPEAAHVRLAVYDILGRKVSSLVDAHREAGWHEAAWQGRDAHGAAAASGVYVYRLQAGDVVQVRRMLLLK